MQNDSSNTHFTILFETFVRIHFHHCLSLIQFLMKNLAAIIGGRLFFSYELRFTSNNLCIQPHMTTDLGSRKTTNRSCEAVRRIALQSRRAFLVVFAANDLCLRPGRRRPRKDQHARNVGSSCSRYLCTNPTGMLQGVLDCADLCSCVCVY